MVEVYLSMMQKFSLEQADKYQIKFSAQTLCITPDCKAIIGGASKELVLICPDRKAPDTVFYKGMSYLTKGNGECRHLHCDNQGTVISAWDDGSILIHKKDKATPVETKSSGAASKVLAINPQKTHIYFIKKDSPKTLVELTIESGLVQEFELKEGDVYQIAANQNGEVFTLDKKGLLQKININTKKLDIFNSPESKSRII